jgi:MFS family permease
LHASSSGDFSDWGVNLKRAALAGSIAGLGVLVGRVGCGYFLDRYLAPTVVAIMGVLAASGIGLLWISNPDVGMPGALLLGLGFGCEVDIMAYLMTRYFGLRSFGVAFGFGFGIFVLAAGIGPTIMGMGFDHTGSYSAPLLLFFRGAFGGFRDFSASAVPVWRLRPSATVLRRRQGGPPMTTVIASDSLSEQPAMTLLRMA